MTFKPKIILRGMFTSFFISSAILAIANIDTVISENGHDKEFSRQRVRMAKDQLRQRLEVTETKAVKPRGLINMLRDSLAQDEFGDTIPFANLSTLDPLSRVLQKGVKHFDRTVFRSPEYQGESGYDLVQYEIEHHDGKHSTILAYLDRPMLTASRNIGAPDSRIPVVLILDAQGDGSTYSLYRAGNLIEQSQIPASDVGALVSERISLSIPFLSVSR